MTILFDQQVPEFDDSDELRERDRAQPLVVEPCDHFVMLTQHDGANDCTHYILIERRDIEAFIEAVRRS